ncbi:MAG: hypothetical protein KKB51_10870 [Candidatus Riflebacteria bacterium]|nr:hypothetical protein [Candidatus Riflebacteria bacterium]
MAQHEVFKRYALIFTRLSRDDFPSFQQIQEYLKRYDINMSARNLQRDVIGGAPPK